MYDQLQHPLQLRGSVHRRLEDVNVDYWRSQAGWADDDATMRSYNEGVYSTWYGGELSSKSGSWKSNSGSTSGSNSGSSKLILPLPWIFGLASLILTLILLVRCCLTAPPKKERKCTTSVRSSRDSSRSVRDKHGERRSRSRSRAASDRSSRSKSRSDRSRSKSRSRKSGEGGGGDDDYKLMDDRSRATTKSSRSRSRSRARRDGSPSRSRSKVRSSKSSSRRDAGEDSENIAETKEQKMLV
ncbi:hypothetical protein ACHAW5_010758 [Stephanodiscus triporus]|uniref:Uncharacterized protein n=1 Tax=Stephanodiscus triporus TaxID=2934178 RepID=A0ABD3PS47_9STRA